MGEWTHAWGRREKWIDGWVDGWREGWMVEGRDGWMD